MLDEALEQIKKRLDIEIVRDSPKPKVHGFEIHQGPMLACKGTINESSGEVNLDVEKVGNCRELAKEMLRDKGINVDE